MREEAVSGPFGFFLRRWRRQVPLSLLFWRDMVVVGTAINLAAVVCGLVALAMKAELAIALLIIHAPLPYNIFLVASVWRSADLAEPKKAGSVRTAAILWLVVSTLI